MSDRGGIVEDLLTADLTLVGATRGARPNEFRDGQASRCAFCPGNEAETPRELASYRDQSGAWTTRVFRNRFPAIEPPSGEHEVIVDSPRHDDEVTVAGVRMWRERYAAALERLPNATPVLFKNSGAFAGATLVHPHTQLMILDRDIPRWTAMVERGRVYRTKRGRCAWCDEAGDASVSGRSVFEADRFRAYVREGSRFGWSLTIAPVDCSTSPLELSAAGCDELALHLAHVTSAIRAEMQPAAAFNLTLVAEPRARPGDFHWSLEVIPRLGTLAGFELATAMFIKSARAKESAERWRRRVAVHYGPL